MKCERIGSMMLCGLVTALLWNRREAVDQENMECCLQIVVCVKQVTKMLKANQRACRHQKHGKREFSDQTKFSLFLVLRYIRGGKKAYSFRPHPRNAAHTSD